VFGFPLQKKKHVHTQAWTRNWKEPLASFSTFLIPQRSKIQKEITTTTDAKAAMKFPDVFLATPQSVDLVGANHPPTLLLPFTFLIW